MISRYIPATNQGPAQARPDRRRNVEKRILCLYIEGTPRIVLEVLSDLLHSGQAIQLADAFDTEGMTDESIANVPYRWMEYSLLVTFLISVLGIALFRKKEIR